MIVFGGYDASVPYSKETLIYNFNGNYWKMLEKLGDVPQPRIRHSSVIVDKKMVHFCLIHTQFIFGGFLQNSERTNTLYALDLTNLTWKKIESFGSIPEPRSSHCCLPSLNENCFLIFNGKHHANKNDIYEFDSTNLKWSTKQIIGKFDIKNNQTACWYKDSIFLYGGKFYDERYNFVECVRFGSALENSMNQYLMKLLDNGILSDVSIVVKETVFHCHKFILSQSSYLRKQIASKDSLELKEVSPDSVKVLLYYLYGTILPNEMNEITIVELFTLSQDFKIDSLNVKLLNHLRKYMSKENVLDLLQIADQRKCKIVKQFCFHFIKLHHEEIIKQPRVKELEKNLLFELLSFGNEEMTSLLDLNPTIEDSNQMNIHLTNMFKSKEFHDISLISEENTSIPAHRAVLYISSQYFQTLFKENNFKDSNSKEMSFQVSHKTLFAVVQFIYQCSCELPNNINGLLEIIQFSDFLMLNGLKEMALGQLLYEITPENAIEVLKLGIEYNIADIVRDSCWKSIYSSNKEILLENLIKTKLESTFDSFAGNKILKDLKDKMMQISTSKIEDLEKTTESNFKRSRQHFEEQLKEQKIFYEDLMVKQQKEFQKSLNNQKLMYETVLQEQKNQFKEFIEELKSPINENEPKKRKLKRDFNLE
jgi:hypothetical protein